MKKPIKYEVEGPLMAICSSDVSKFTLVVHPDDADKTLSLFSSLGEKASVIGRVTDKEGVEIALL